MNERHGSGLLSAVFAGLAVATAILAPIYLLWRFGVSWAVAAALAFFTVCALHAEAVEEAARSWLDCTQRTCALSSVGEVLLGFSRTGWWTLAGVHLAIFVCMTIGSMLEPKIDRLVNGTKAAS